MDTITPALENYAETFNAETYHYRLVNPVTEDVKLGNYTPKQFIGARGFFYAHNQRGFNIYCRPVGYQFVLLDDLTRDVLADVAELKPCMLLETSPGNFQAWLTLPEIPTDRETARAICKALAVRFGADLASAEPDHVGRLPVFANLKEKHRRPDGKFPPVKLHRWEPRLSTFYPFGGAVLNTPTTPPTISTAYQYAPGISSTSEQDFGVACGLLRIGKADNEIYQYLLSTSSDLVARKGKQTDSYLQRTIRNAHKAIQRP